MDNDTLSIRNGITFLMERHSLAKNRLNVNAFNCEHGDPTNHIEYMKRMPKRVFGINFLPPIVVRGLRAPPIYKLPTNAGHEDPDKCHKRIWR